MELKNLFRQPRHVWVLEYGITHGVMRLAVHDGDFPRYTEVVCGGCTYFCGHLQGGPYSISLEATDDGLLLRADGLRLLCSTANVTRERL